jgi:hypothetical protein
MRLEISGVKKTLPHEGSTTAKALAKHTSSKGQARYGSSVKKAFFYVHNTWRFAAKYAITLSLIQRCVQFIITKAGATPVVVA